MLQSHLKHSFRLTVYVSIWNGCSFRMIWIWAKQENVKKKTNECNGAYSFRYDFCVHLCVLRVYSVNDEANERFCI